MKRLIPEEYRNVSRAAMAVIAFAALLAAGLIYLDRITAFLSSLMSTLTPFFFGGALAFIQMPIDRRLSSLLRKTLFRKRPEAKTVRVISTVTSLLLIVALLVLFCYILLPQVVNSGSTLVNQVTTFVNENDEAINKNLKRLGLISEDVDPLNSAWQNILSYATNYASLLPTVLRTSYNVVYTSIFTLFIGLIVSVYLLWDRERLSRQAKKLCYALMKQDTCEVFIYWVRRASRTFAGFTTGKIIDSLIVGALCYVFMLITGLEYSALISVIVGVTNILPFFGPLIGAVPSILILLIVNPSSALKFGIFILILQQIDGNIIGPKILGDYTGISSLLTMVSIIVGSALFGFVGMLLSVPVCAVLYAMFKTVMNKRLADKGLPESSDAYGGEDPPKPLPVRAAAEKKPEKPSRRSRS